MITRLKKLGAFFDKYSRAVDEVVGMNRRNADFVYRYNARKDYPLVDDKLVCKERMALRGVPMAQTLDVCAGLFDVERTVEGLADESQFVVKPANGSGGKGILVLGERCVDASPEGEPVTWKTPGGRLCSRADLREQLANIVFGAFGRKMSDRALIERRITPHAQFLELWPDGVCDLRVILLEGKPLMAMLRVPTLRSGGKANLHQGGIGVAVEIASGRTFRASQKGEEIRLHPETGTPLLGLQLPVWSKVLEVAQLAASAVPLGYLGVDLVIDEQGTPLVLEMNARPGLEIQNVNGLSIEVASAQAAIV